MTKRFAYRCVLLIMAFVLGLLVGRGTVSVDKVEAAPLPAPKIVVQEWCAMRDMDIELKKLTIEDLADE